MDKLQAYLVDELRTGGISNNVGVVSIAGIPPQYTLFRGFKNM